MKKIIATLVLGVVLVTGFGVVNHYCTHTTTEGIVTKISNDEVYVTIGESLYSFYADDNGLSVGDNIKIKLYNPTEFTIPEKTEIIGYEK